MKHYLYVSDTKPDMMSAQIPRKLRDRIAAELKLDLKLVSVDLRQNRSDDTRYSKLDLVPEYLLTQLGEEVGTIDEPGPYLTGTLEMRWGPLDPDFTGSPRAVYFVGQTDRSLVGLGGSIDHVMGGAGSMPSAMSSSMTPILFALLKAHAAPDEQADLGPLDDISAKLDEAHSAAFAPRLPTLLSPDLLLDPARCFDVSENVEFIARRLSRTTPDSGAPGWGDFTAAVLGSPIYVAAAN